MRVGGVAIDAAVAAAFLAALRASALHACLAAAQRLEDGHDAAPPSSAFALTQQAYRDGGLGAPLATLTLVDPLGAGALGVLLLGEALNSTPKHLALAGCGGAATVLGVVLLS